MGISHDRDIQALKDHTQLVILVYPKKYKDRIVEVPKKCKDATPEEGSHPCGHSQREVVWSVMSTILWDGVLRGELLFSITPQEHRTQALATRVHAAILKEGLTKANGLPRIVVFDSNGVVVADGTDPMSIQAKFPVSVVFRPEGPPLGDAPWPAQDIKSAMALAEYSMDTVKVGIFRLSAKPTSTIPWTTRSALGFGISRFRALSCRMCRNTLTLWVSTTKSRRVSRSCHTNHKTDQSSRSSLTTSGATAVPALAESPAKGRARTDS